MSFQQQPLLGTIMRLHFLRRLQPQILNLLLLLGVQLLKELDLRTVVSLLSHLSQVRQRRLGGLDAASWANSLLPGSLILRFCEVDILHDLS